MNYVKVQSVDTPELEIYAKLRDKAFNLDNGFIADSPQVVNVLLETELEIKSLLATQEYYEEFRALIEAKNVPKLYVASKEEMQKIVGHRVHHNCMAHGVRPAQTPLERLGDGIIMLDEITSRENVGSIARSAAALGVDSYLLPKTAPHPYQRRSLRVSMGHVSKLKVRVYDDIFATLKALKDEGYEIFGAEVTEKSIKLADVKVPKKWVLLMGHEGKGLSQEVLNACSSSVKIEMQANVRSFNVAVAASIMMYKFKTY